MEVISTGFEGLYEIRPRIFEDERGWFMESFNQARYAKELGSIARFVQDNISCSGKHSLRGLHFQAPPFAQSKLVMVTQGKALDIVVDIRPASATYGLHYKVMLDAKSKNQLYVPRGFAHGFVALEDDTHFQYKCDNIYHKDSERTILWSDVKLGIDWGVLDPIISEKDLVGESFNEFQTPF
jgi:dTDP-4-dehydrorhamnose 3,5-epimerase